MGFTLWCLTAIKLYATDNEYNGVNIRCGDSPVIAMNHSEETPVSRVRSSLFQSEVSPKIRCQNNQVRSKEPPSLTLTA